MVFSDSSTKLGIVEDVDFLLFGSTTATSPYALADKVRNINVAYDEVADLIMKADHSWEWDDNNKTDLPEATAALVANQQDYGITDVTFLKILKIEIKDSSGNWNPLFPIGLDQKRQVSITDYMKTAGIPREYDKRGGSLYLYPKPNYSQSASLKILYQRLPTLFTASSTTDVPGFNRAFHRLLSYKAALTYAIAHGMNGKINTLSSEIGKLEVRLVDFYGTRDHDEKQSFSTDKEDYGHSSGFDGGLGDVGFTN